MEFRFYDKPGLWMTPDAQAHLRKTLRDVAATSLQPVPDYQCLGSAPGALDDKLIVVAYQYAGGGDDDDDPETSARAVAFISTFLFEVPAIAAAPVVLHTGLTVVDPAHRRRGGTVMRLFAQLAVHAFPRYGGESGLWVTCLAEVPSSLGLVTQYLEDVYPSPEIDQDGGGGGRGRGRGQRPSKEHRIIARAISEGLRPRLLISPRAVLDEESFVFRGSNDWPAGECFKKDPDDERWRHREPSWNAFFREMLRAGSGDEVLQVGFCSRERVALVLNVLGGKKRGSVGAKI